jgi:hypothetical protein
MKGKVLVSTSPLFQHLPHSSISSQALLLFFFDLPLFHIPFHFYHMSNPNISPNTRQRIHNVLDYLTQVGALPNSSTSVSVSVASPSSSQLPNAHQGQVLANQPISGNFGSIATGSGMPPWPPETSNVDDG